MKVSPMNTKIQDMSMMEKSVQEITLEKISKSVQESYTLEKLISTEQFLNLYYRHFPYTTQYLKQEWVLDSQIKEKKQDRAMLDEEVNPFIFPEKKSA